MRSLQDIATGSFLATAFEQLLEQIASSRFSERAMAPTSGQLHSWLAEHDLLICYIWEKKRREQEVLFLNGRNAPDERIVVHPHI